MEQVYANIKERRIELQMSQEDLARKVGYTDRSSIAKVELGKVNLSLEMLRKFAQALDTTMTDLLDYVWEDEGRKR